MRTHYLRELLIGGKEEMLALLPDFDFYNLRLIKRLNWTMGEDDFSSLGGGNLRLTAIYETSSGCRAIEILLNCRGVKHLKLPELGARFYLNEIEVEDVSGHQIEGVRYKLKDFGESSFEVHCGDVEISLGERE